MALSLEEQKILEAIDENADRIYEIAEKIYNNPELGYCEFKTSQAVSEVLESLGIKCKKGLARTGVRGSFGKEDGFNLCIIGEMDAVKCSEHKAADNVTGAAHACGHHAQIAAMIGAAFGLVESGVESKLDGKVTFFAVPAEEYIELDYRRELKEKGEIQYFGGKQQLIAEGEFDDVDAAMMVHAQAETPEECVYVHGGSLGFIEKEITFYGKESHASEPSKGINALNAAALAILGMHTNRERFREEDKIRVHPIITNGGDVVNSVPSKVCMDGYVRGASMKAIQDAGKDTDRAILGAAQIVGATAEIETTVGYQPLNQDRNFGEVFRMAAEDIFEGIKVVEGVDMTGSTDMGDLSQIIPCIQPTIGGFCGALHSKEFVISKAETAYLNPAKIMAITAFRLLSNGAQEGKRIKESFNPAMTKEEYIKILNSK